MSTRRQDRRKSTRRDSGRAATITLRMDPAEQVTLTIRDTGIGLPADEEVHAAVGFGLPLSHGWIHLMRPDASRDDPRLP
jgi:signal transduction histidine kinase